MIKDIFLRFSVLILLLSLDGSAQTIDPKIAFLADVHLQDIFGDLSDSDFEGLSLANSNENVLIRTMESQLHSTRIFNENYFAFIAALEDIASRGIHLVALPGDYSDDGQPLHLRGLQKILEAYSKKYDLQFFITTGNHDPASPFIKESGKRDFLGKYGKPQPIFSKSGIYESAPYENPVVISADLAKMGYSGIIKYLGSFGFNPNPKYIYWATPFSNYDPAKYDFKKAQEAASLSKRMFKVTPNEKSYDLSYVVEPIKGLLLMAIDGDVFIPNNKGGYQSASIGYNNVITHKAHLIDWVRQVAQYAEKNQKTLIAFSHFPMIDFNDDATQELSELMGEDKFQLARVPIEKVADTFADAGLKIHVAGHMHINDTGRRTTKKGNTLINIQSPSLAAYLPGYKIVTLKKDYIEVETIVLDEVLNFNKLFPLYSMEYLNLQANHKTEWDPAILKASSYNEFTEWHLKELVRLRFIPQDFPKTLSRELPKLSGTTLLLLAFNKPNNLSNYIEKLRADQFFFKEELVRLKTHFELNSHSLEMLSKIDGMDLIFDFYRIRSADKLAFLAIGTQRLQLYDLLIDTWLDSESVPSSSELERELILFFKIFKKLQSGEPAIHFKIDYTSGKLDSLD
ncbi:calcineurin-like phosphoesterase family protein [Leeuwenhoekiella aestuarii]|uniref:Calcineurin-like phosphoesterase family protein n=1 Tax=Leeuwenhoekiella aestuarii TaxID=2249426 RepID=A0A4Q0NPE1_9FLAO|nr:metallophosphoesterase [Leeuwenhoekiella aestuarii]RXG11559.1 calcineurin-like phosphoesterase family protein [Leeuwenhoekiella aestuarii]RXG12076.1 calcineurin-like phosphoesterase family protein [Leeuwenhoekiella aestuarii]